MGTHITVLLTEAVDMLAIAPDGVYVDATLGAGGHTSAILKKLGTNGTLLSLDVDPSAIAAFAAKKIETPGEHLLAAANFKDLTRVLKEHELRSPDGILADLGWRTEQFTQGEKGFSFAADEPLLMTYGDPDTYAFTAADVVNEWAEEDISNVIYAYGEERAARKIAKVIVESRDTTPIRTAKQLADLVASVVRVPPRSRIHPATRTFQALRIVVNDELSILESFIDHSFTALAPHGRLVIITFHSLEDRIVKHRFRSLATTEEATVVTKKPITASDVELKNNNRARSAKLRVLQKHDPNEN